MNAAQSAPFDTTKIAGLAIESDAIARVTMVARLLDSAFFIPGHQPPRRLSMR